MKKISKTKGKRIRLAVQLFFFILITLIVINHNLEEAGMAGIPLIGGASLHAVCPFGGVVSISSPSTIADDTNI